jgi:hypothetical protein
VFPDGAVLAGVVLELGVEEAAGVVLVLVFAAAGLVAAAGLGLAFFGVGFFLAVVLGAAFFGADFFAVVFFVAMGFLTIILGCNLEEYGVGEGNQSATICLYECPESCVNQQYTTALMK